jgi:hypothetical protein
VPVAAWLSALFIGAPLVWGYTNPIENQSTETVTNIWDLRSTNL